MSRSICSQVMSTLIGMVFIGALISAGYYFRFEIKTATELFFLSPFMVAVYNFFVLYVVAIGLAGAAECLGVFQSLEYRRLFQMVAFAKRHQLKDMGFFDEENMQRGTCLKYPETTEEAEDMANRGFLSAAAIMIFTVTAVITSVILGVIPENVLLVKSVVYLGALISILTSFAHLSEICMFDIKIIKRRVFVEGDIEQIPMRIVPQAQEPIQNPPEGEQEILRVPREYLGPQPQLVNDFHRQQGDRAAMAAGRPRRRDRQAGLRPPRIARRDKLDSYPKRHNYLYPNPSITPLITIMTSTVIYSMLRLIGLVSSSVVDYYWR